MYWRKFSKQHYVAVNSLSKPTRISKHKQERRQFAVAAYYDYYMHVLTR